MDLTAIFQVKATVCLIVWRNLSGGPNRGRVAAIEFELQHQMPTRRILDFLRRLYDSRTLNDLAVLARVSKEMLLSLGRQRGTNSGIRNIG